jgi:hypothetical protein
VSPATARRATALLVLVCCAVPWPAAAAPKDGSPARVAVLPFTGPAANRPEQRLRNALRQREAHVQVVAPRKVRAELTAAGGAPGDAEGYAALAHALGASALVEGRVTRRGQRWVVDVQVRAGVTGEVIGQTRWAHAQVGPLLARIGRQAWARLGPTLQEAPPPAPAASEAPQAAPEAVPEGPVQAADVEAVPAQATAKDADAPAADGGPRAPDQALRLAAGMHLMSRDFVFTDDLFGALAGYNIGAAPALALEGEWYPGAHFTDGVGAHFGVRLRYVRMVGVESAVSRGGDARYDTLFDRIEAGLRGRVPFERGEIGLGAEFGQQRFGVQIPEDAQARGLPGVRYRFMRLEAGGSFQPRRWLRFDMTGGYLHPFSFGELGSDAWFPRMRGGGLDGRFVTAFVTEPGVEIRLAGEVRYMFFDMRSEPGDAWVAGGAVDRVWSLGLELGWRL